MNYINDLVEQMTEEVIQALDKRRLDIIKTLDIYVTSRCNYLFGKGIVGTNFNEEQFTEAHDYAMSFLRDYIWFGGIE